MSIDTAHISAIATKLARWLLLDDNGGLQLIRTSRIVKVLDIRRRSSSEWLPHRIRDGRVLGRHTSVRRFVVRGIDLSTQCANVPTYNRISILGTFALETLSSVGPIRSRASL